MVSQSRSIGTKIKSVKWHSEYNVEEARYDYWTTLRKTPLGEIFVLISLTPKSTKSYVQEVAVWIGEGDEPVYRTKEKIPLDVTRTIQEVAGLQKNILCDLTNRLNDASDYIGGIVLERR